MTLSNDNYPKNYFPLVNICLEREIPCVFAWVLTASKDEGHCDILGRWIFSPQSKVRELASIESFLCQTLPFYSIFNEYLLSATMFWPYILISANAVGMGQTQSLLLWILYSGWENKVNPENDKYIDVWDREWMTGWGDTKRVNMR